MKYLNYNLSITVDYKAGFLCNRAESLKGFVDGLCPPEDLMAVSK